MLNCKQLTQLLDKLEVTSRARDLLVFAGQFEPVENRLRRFNKFSNS